MYDVVFKIVIRPLFTELEYIKRSRKHTFINYMKKHLAGYKIYDDDYKFVGSRHMYFIKDGMSINDENDIEEYNKMVNEFKQFADEEYNKITKYCSNAKVVAYMGVYNKDVYEKNEIERWSIQTYLENNNKMPDYDTILKYYCEVKTYNPQNKTIKSEFKAYEDIREHKNLFSYDKIVKFKLMSINKIREQFNELFCDEYSRYFFGREEMIGGYIPKYKVGDIVLYNDMISIIRDAPEPVEQYGNKMMCTAYNVDYITKRGYYYWVDGGLATDSDFKPYTGEVPEFMKLFQKAVLEQDGYHLDEYDNISKVDRLLISRNVITEFNDFKDELIELFKI